MKRRRRSNPTLLLILCLHSLCPTCVPHSPQLFTPSASFLHCPCTPSLILLSPVTPHPSVHSFPITQFPIHCIHPLVLYLLSIIHLFLHSPLFIHSPTITYPSILHSSTPPLLSTCSFMHHFIACHPVSVHPFIHQPIIHPVLHSSIHSPLTAPLFISFSIQFNLATLLKL